uniref:Protein kinase domain-containing protein n=1 Tax=Globisporangium ultimum (strain ATCC 200006 / CBS 805.95 / DAOM BR144) TaxID=431595 RepID=K3W6W1_GLOUD
MHRYETMELLGNGSFGEVVKARSLKTNEIVAIKKIKALFPTWEECLQLRELKSLRVLRHENIVQLKEVIRDKEELYFVFEYMQSSLCKVIQLARHPQQGESDIAGATNSSNGTGASLSSPASSPSWLSEAQIRSIMYQLFCGLAHMHKHGFFHRDIKPENLLCHENTLKLADLGQAREIRSRPPYTDYVSTRWYRAPELLLRFHSYNSPIDLWACGCIMAELFLQVPLFPGSSEADQLCRICKVLGTPTKDTWADGITMVAQMQFKFPKCASVPWTHILPPNTSKAALQLIQELLQYDPSRRITATQALQHRYFDQHPVTRPMLTPPALLQASMAQQQQQVPLKAEYKTVASSMMYGGSKKGGGDDGPVHSGWARSSTESLGSSRNHGYDAASSSSYLQAKHSSVLLSPRELHQQLPIAESKSALSSSAWRDTEKKSAKETCYSVRKCSVASPEDLDDSVTHKDGTRHHLPHLQQSMRTQSEDHLLQDLLDEFIA